MDLLRMVFFSSGTRLAAAAITVAVAGGLAQSLIHSGPTAPSRELSRQGPLALDIADGLGAIAAGHRDLWVDDRARERLIRVDGADGRVLAAIPVKGRLAVSSVAAVNPRTGAVAWRRRLGFRAGAVVRAHGLLWVHSAARDDPGDRLTALDPATGEARATVLLPAFGTTGMALQGGRLWLATAGGRVLAVRLAPPP